MKKGVIDLWVSIPGDQRLRSTPSTCIYSDLFPDWHAADNIAKPQVCINWLFQHFVNWLQKPETGNGNLQQEIEINEYSSSKKLLE